MEQHERNIRPTAWARIMQEGTLELILQGLGSGTPFRICFVDKRGHGMLETPEWTAFEDGKATTTLQWAVNWSRLRCVVLLPRTGITIEVDKPSNADLHRPTYSEAGPNISERIRRGLKSSGLDEALSGVIGDPSHPNFPPRLEAAVKRAKRHETGKVLVVQERTNGEPVLAVYYQAPEQRRFKLVEQVPAAEAGPWQQTALDSWPDTGSPDAHRWEFR